MTENEKEKLIRQYAAGEVTWHSLRERGFDDYVQVLGALVNSGCGRQSRRWRGRTSRRGSVGALSPEALRARR